MSANHSDCWYANRKDRVPVTGTRYTMFLKTASDDGNASVVITLWSRLWTCDQEVVGF